MNQDKQGARPAPNVPAWLTKPPEPGWRWRVIGITALIFGVAGGLLAWRMNGNAENNVIYTLGLAMLMPAYFTIPRTKTLRMWQGSLAGVLGGIIVMVVLFLFFTPQFWPSRIPIFVAFGGYVPGVVAWSWVMTWLTQKTEKRRAEMEERRLRREANAERDKKKSGVRLDASGKPIRVHRYNNKRGKR
ncbi:MAG: hypothetical protein OWU32_06370 [Firmicutes bacterium]|nr:hypothetical protein [Bacillota bacterium]